MEKVERIFYIDVLNICACIAVVALHVNGAYWKFSHDRYWITSSIIETVFYFAVPVFTMITGINLIDYRERYDTKTYFKKRYVRTVLTYLIWTILAGLWDVFYLKSMNISDFDSLAKIIDILVNSKTMSIYWFFPMIFSLYLAIPVIGIIPREKRVGINGIYTYMILYSFLTISVLPLIFRVTGIGWNEHLVNPICNGYLMIAIIGYYIENVKIKKSKRIIIYILGALGLWIHFYMTIIYSYRLGSVDRTFKGYCNFPSVIYSVAVFVWFKYHNWENTILFKHKEMVRKISNASLGIYLVHYFVLQYIENTFSINIASSWWRIFGVILVYGASFIIIFVLKRVPIIRRCIP